MVRGFRVNPPIPPPFTGGECSTVAQCHGGRFRPLRSKDGARGQAGGARTQVRGQRVAAPIRL